MILTLLSLYGVFLIGVGVGFIICGLFVGGNPSE
jgi:hypothetical protein